MHRQIVPPDVAPASDDLQLNGSDRLAVLPHRAFLGDRRRDAETGWHVLHTLSRHEKVLATTLTGMGISCYLPLRRHVLRRGGRRLDARLPLFPSYVFLWANVDETYAADRTGRVAHVIPVQDQATLEWELSNLSLALDAQAPLDPYDALRVGLRARVVAGPLSGVEGVVASRTRLDRLVLQVRMLGTAASLEVDAANVALIDD
jgi:transcription antitermination factor NusG